MEHSNIFYSIEICLKRNKVISGNALYLESIIGKNLYLYWISLQINFDQILILAHYR